MQRFLILFVLACLAVFVIAGKTTITQDQATASEVHTGEQWEYLVVSGANNNLTPSSNPRMRKEPAPFSREAFVLEQNLDKLGAKGWELLVVSGSTSDPIYYFKRRKQA